MATKTYYFLGTAAESSNFGALQDGGSAPTAANTSGWDISLTTANYASLMAWNTTRANSTFTSASQLTTTPSNTAKDCWRTQNALYGNFDSGNWDIALKVRCDDVNGNPKAHFRLRVWASPTADFTASGREISSGSIAGAAPTLSVANTDYSATATWSAPAISLANEYLFLQAELVVDTPGGAGGGNNFYVRAGPSSITTTNFQITGSGTIAATEAPDTAAIAGSVKWLATLAAIEAPDTAASTGNVSWSATLAATEAADTAAIVGNVAASGALAATEAADTAVVVGSTGSGALAATEAPDTAAGVLISEHRIVLAATEGADLFAGVGLLPAIIAVAAVEQGDRASFQILLGFVWPRLAVAVMATEAPDVMQAFVAVGPIGNLEHDGVGGRLIYSAACGLERALADVEVARMMATPARLITENLDPWKVSKKNLVFLAHGMGVTLWEPSWSESVRREWVANQWAFKQAVGSLPAFRMALGASGYDIEDYVTPPGGFFASPDLTADETNEWLRHMPQIRIKFAKKTGTEGIDEMAADPDGAVGSVPGPDGSFIDSAAIGLNNGRALYGNVAVLRYADGHEVPLEMWDRVDTVTKEEHILFEQISVPEFLPNEFFLTEDFLDDSRFLIPDNGAGRVFSFFTPEVKDAITPGLAMTPLAPGLTPLSPRYEINSDIEYDRVLSSFADDWTPNIETLTTDNGATLLAHRMYLLDPTVSAAMNFGVSFVDEARVGIPCDYAELAVNTHTLVPMEAFVLDDSWSGEGYAEPEDLTDFDRARRSVNAAKSLRDTILLSFEQNLDIDTPVAALPPRVKPSGPILLPKRFATIAATENPDSARVAAAAYSVPVNVTLPWISGIGQVGQLLTLDVGTWTNNPTSFTRKLKRSGGVIAGATGATYTPTSADVGQKLTLEVTASNQFGPGPPAESVITQFGVYKTTIGGGPPIKLFTSDNQEMTHIRVSPDGLYYSYTTFYKFNTATPPLAIEDGADYRDSEIVIVRISDMSVVARITHNPLYVNSNNPWLPDSSAIVFLTTDPAITLNGYVCIAKYTLATGLSTRVWNPAYPVSDPHVRYDGKIVHVKGGGAATQIWVLSSGVDYQITAPTQSGFAGAGDTDPEWSVNGTKIACSRRVSAGVYRIVVITINPTTFAVISELEIVPFGAVGALDGTPKWTNDGRIVYWHFDVTARGDSGLYLINADGTGRVRVPHPAHLTASQPVVELGLSSALASTPIYFSGQYIPIFPA